MGIVWRGHDEMLGRAVAVKEVRFPPEIAPGEQSELRERTLREARATARLSHPNVVTTYDVVEEDGRPWIVMELVDARSLSEILRTDGPLPPNRVAEVGLQMLDALELSHQQGVVHRDVKPGNVLITPQGRAVLTDFGIATMSGDPSMTSTGVVLGSPAYMSPERARGQRPGPEADLWALGATLYAAVEGKPPYEQESALGTLTAVISDPVEPPAVGGPLAEAILGMLEKDPAARANIAQTRTVLRRAVTVQASTTVTLPSAEVGALERGGRTQALPVEANSSAKAPGAAPTMVEPPPRAAYAPIPPPRSLWRDDDQDLPPRERSWTGVLVAFTALLLLGGLAFLLLRDGGDDTKTEARPQAGASSSAAESREPTKAAETTPPPTTDAPATATGEPEVVVKVPAGYEMYTDDTGFSVAIPEGWQPQQRSATAIDFKEPGGSRYLRVDQTDDPKGDPVADWTQQEKSLSKRLAGYQRIRIEPVDYRDYDTADWEFTHGNTHVLNRGMDTGDKGYALYWSTPSSKWDESRPMFDVFARTFRPAGDED